jgi:hypothetical protein
LPDSRRRAVSRSASSTVLGPTMRSCSAARSDDSPRAPDPSAMLSSATSRLQYLTSGPSSSIRHTFAHRASCRERNFWPHLNS